MSNLLYMDESNGNGVYAAKAMANLSTAAAAAPPSGPTTTAIAISITQQQQHNNLNTTNATTTTGSPSNNNIMNSAARSAAVAAAATVVDNLVLPTSVSNEDLSQSLSEYTDADESISAPTEFLAEFLSAVMLKDYKKALKYCKLILQYEPNNSTAKEFYPLILDKLRGHTSDDSDENYNKSSSPDLVLEVQSSDPSGGDGYLDGSDERHLPDEPYDEPGIISSSSCSAGLSMSDSVDDDDDDVDDDNVDDEDDDEEDDVMSSSGDDLPIDDAAEECGGDSLEVSGGAEINAGNTDSSRNSSSGGGGRSRSDNTTHSYSSLLLEEEDDIVPVSLQFAKAPELPSPDLDVSNGNKMPSASCSDSESPTEPLTQRLAAILRSKCGVSNSGPGPGDK